MYYYFRNMSEVSCFIPSHVTFVVLYYDLGAQSVFVYRGVWDPPTAASPSSVGPGILGCACCNALAVCYASISRQRYGTLRTPFFVVVQMIYSVILTQCQVLIKMFMYFITETVSTH